MDPIDALVDWDLARATARRAAIRVSPGLRVGSDEATAVVNDLYRLAAQARAHVVDASGLDAADPAPVRVLDRAAWAEATVEGVRGLFTPLVAGLQRGAPSSSRAISSLTRRVLGAEIGGLVALLSGRVIGQYEPISGHLLLVAPNVVAAERALGVPAEEFRMWVCLHEQTHALQFTGVPWVREHFLHLLSQLGPELKIDPRAIVHRIRGVAAAPRAQRELPLLAALLAGPDQQRVLEDVQSLMTVLEGHAEHVMDVAGAELLPSLARMRGQLDERRRSPGGPVTWLVRHLLGVDAKLAQYARGKDFCDEVARRSGESGLGTVWEAPGALPSRAEIADPTRWLTRVLGTPASV